MPPEPTHTPAEQPNQEHSNVPVFYPTPTKESFEVPPAEQQVNTSGKLPGAFQLFSPSWQAFKLNFGAFFLGAIFPFVILVLPIIIYAAQQGVRQRTGTLYLNNSPSSATFNVAAIVLGILAIFLVAIIFVPYMYLLKLQSAKGIKVKFRTNFKHSFHYLWRVFALSFLRGLFILAGLILFIVPGLFMWRRYMLAPYYLIDEDTGINDALKKSAADSKPFSYALWGMMGVYILMAALGIIPLLGGLASAVLTIAYCCAQATRYLQIKSAKT